MEVGCTAAVAAAGCTSAAVGSAVLKQASVLAELASFAVEISLGAAVESLRRGDIAAITTDTTVMAGEAALLPG